jgi:hypothetical protein
MLAAAGDPIARLCTSHCPSKSANDCAINRSDAITHPFKSLACCSACCLEAQPSCRPSHRSQIDPGNAKLVSWASAGTFQNAAWIYQLSVSTSCCESNPHVSLVSSCVYSVLTASRAAADRRPESHKGLSVLGASRVACGYDPVQHSMADGAQVRRALPMKCSAGTVGHCVQCIDTHLDTI